MITHRATLQWLTNVSADVVDALDWGPDTGAPLGLDVSEGEYAKVLHLFAPVRWMGVTWDPYAPATSPLVGPRKPLSVMKLPDQLPSQGYAVVLCEGVLDRVGPSWPTLLLNCVRLVAPGGHLVLTCPRAGAQDNPGGIDPNQLADQLLPLTETHGFIWRQFAVDLDADAIHLHLEFHPRAAEPPPPSWEYHGRPSDQARLIAQMED